MNQKADNAAKAATARRGEVVELPPAAEARVARPATPQPRHRAVVASFLACVAVPAVAATAYLYGMAADQYASRVAFSVRSAETAAPIELLGALSQSFSGGGGDAQIVYEFVRSQEMVERALAALPLERMFNVPARDLVFRLGEDQPIEDVVDYWNRMTDVAFDAGPGIVVFDARAFAPEDAQAIARFALDESTRLVNALSDTARADAISVAREVLDEAEARLAGVRREIRSFRDIEQALDPSETARAALERVAALESAVAEARVELDSLLELVGERSPRLEVLRQRIASLDKQAVEERRRLGSGALERSLQEGRSVSDLLAEYEDLAVEREFAEKAYLSALASYEQALVEARRQSRYLAPHIQPTLSVEAQYPQRALMAAGLFAALLVAWSVLVLIAYNIRDRR